MTETVTKADSKWNRKKMRETDKDGQGRKKKLMEKIIANRRGSNWQRPTEKMATYYRNKQNDEQN